MKKFLFSMMTVTYVFLLLFSAVCCSNKISSISDLKRFSDMQKRADKIEVDFDNGTQEGFLFTITDESEISDIMEIISTSSLESCGKIDAPAPLGNTYITIYQGVKTYHLGVYYALQDDEFYRFTTRNLYNKIYELATKYQTLQEKESQDYVLRISADKQVYSANEKILIDITLKNESGVDVEISYHYPSFFVPESLTGEFPDVEQSSEIAVLSFKNGEMIHLTESVEDYFRVGHHELKYHAVFSLGRQASESEVVVVSSNSIEFSIVA